LARVSTLIKLPPQQGKELCLELFRMASADKDLRRRIVGQKSAVRYLSYFDPALAMSLLREVSVQQPEPGKPLYEDPRYNAAVDLFINYLEKLKPRGPSTVIDAGRYLGQTGQFPYRAMAAVIEHLPPFLRGETNNILSDALSFYARETAYRNRDEEFLVLLHSLLKNSDVSKDLMEQALNTFVQRLSHDRIDVPGDYYSEIYTATGSRISFADRNQAFLFQVFPVVRRFNSGLATQLLQQYPELDQATDEMRYISGGFVPGSWTPERANRQHMAWLQESLLTRVKERADCDLNSASQLAQQLADTGSRIVGFSATVPAVARKSLPEARKIYNAQLQELANVRHPSDRFHAEVTLAAAAYSVGDSTQYRSMKDDAFDLGIAFVNQEARNSPGERIQNLQSFDQLKELVTRISALPPNGVSTRIQQLPDSWLKAFLLVYAAEGHTALVARSVPPAKCAD